MNAVAVVVLVAGFAILARRTAGRKSFSLNQRIVLSGIAIGLLVWDQVSTRGEFDSKGLALIGLAVFILMSSLVFLGRHKGSKSSIDKG